VRQKSENTNPEIGRQLKWGKFVPSIKLGGKNYRWKKLI
jgi:hypothetical protein